MVAWELEREGPGWQGLHARATQVLAELGVGARRGDYRPEEAGIRSGACAG